MFGHIQTQYLPKHNIVWRFQFLLASWGGVVRITTPGGWSSWRFWKALSEQWPQGIWAVTSECKKWNIPVINIDIWNKREIERLFSGRLSENSVIFRINLVWFLSSWWENASIVHLYILHTKLNCFQFLFLLTAGWCHFVPPLIANKYQMKNTS